LTAESSTVAVVEPGFETANRESAVVVVPPLAAGVANIVASVDEASGSTNESDSTRMRNGKNALVTASFQRRRRGPK
jgi:hypothetical protein